MDGMDRSDRPVIIGAGLAGLMTALQLAPEPVIVLAKTPLGSGIASAFAQGGVAAAIGADDAPQLHAADTLAAGDGLSDPAVVARITAAAPAAIAALAQRGVAFDRGQDGGLLLGLEAAHGRRRIVHAGGDRSGSEIMRALIAAVRQTPSITVLDGVEARRLLVADGRVAGVLAASATETLVLPASRVVIATGGLGGLYRHTTNPLGALGQGVALAARAGAVLADMEFVQFHPTALDVGLDPMPLVSEAVRGEGAVLIDESGGRFTDELKPRDQVSRAVWRHLGDGHPVFLDAREALGTRFAARFPAIAAHCRAAGLDPARDAIPVRPAVHYHMGGIAVDAEGRSTVPGLWAAGEVAATGLHGANRLASNSLLEAAVCGRWVADSIAGTARRRLSLLPPVPALSPAAEAGPVRTIMTQGLGVLRERTGIGEAIAQLRELAFAEGPAADPAAVGLAVAVAALAREESRGAHWRSDFPTRSAAPARRSRLRLGAHDVILLSGPAAPALAAAGD
ncbi:MAG TPA: L-aspartate oxidase [Stellaceae bacterium]|nr:L-aspartate oxidase [Stellaceae bacterium]